MESFSFKYKDINFKISLRRARSDMEESGIKVPEKEENTPKPAEISITKSWKEIELAAKERVNALILTNKSFSNFEDDPIGCLEFTGALVPSTSRAIRELRHLYNQAIDSVKFNVSRESVIEYATLAKTIARQISSITSLPKQKLTVLTFLVLEYNQLLDSRKFNDITIDEVHNAIKNKNIIPWLAETTTGYSDFSPYTDTGPYSVYLEFYYEQMIKICDAYAGAEYRKWGVKNLGLCVLIAWTNEIIQQGSGWHPNE